MFVAFATPLVRDTDTSIPTPPRAPPQAGAALFEEAGCQDRRLHAEELGLLRHMERLHEGTFRACVRVVVLVPFLPRCARHGICATAKRNAAYHVHIVVLWMLYRLSALG